MTQPHHLSAAKHHVFRLRESVIARLANTIQERGWTQAQTAEYLGVSQPRISNLLRGQTEKFTLDTLVEMLFALDKPVTLAMGEDKAWSRSMKMDPDDPQAHETISYYTRVIHHDPRNATAYRRRAAAYHQLGQHELAIGDYTRSIELEPDRPGGLADRSNVYRAAGQYTAALLDCEELIRRFPDYNVFQNRALIYLDMEDDTKALADMDRSVELDPNRPGPWYNRAFLLEKLGRWEEALRDFERTLEIDPTSQRAREAAEVVRAKMVTGLNNQGR